MNLVFLPNEVWFGGATSWGIEQPYTVESCCFLDLRQNRTPNQIMPVLVSTKGRWIWNECGMTVSFENGIITLTDDTITGQNGTCLRDAYLAVMHKFFPFHQCNLSSKLYETPVYNTWIELTFNQQQSAIIQYAKDVIANGLPAGVLIIDDGWSDYYGRWSFSKKSFYDAPYMLRQLHEMGFSVMLWICPFITPDTAQYRELEGKDLLVKRGNGEVHITHWWNGWSAILDMTKQDACHWLKKQMDELSAMGVDGFKFDAGDSMFYPTGTSTSPDKHSQAWAHFGEQYTLNEYRVTASAGGWSLMQRLCDKDHSWGENGLAALIPNAIVQSLTGHPFLCPDMIGGGEYINFQRQEVLDGELFVRWAQIACLMPVMQFSAAPWRVLEPFQFRKILKSVQLRNKFMAHLQDAWEKCTLIGEPIIRPMAYQFPNEQCQKIVDQFVLGENMIVAPIITKQTQSRRVYLPKGNWLFNENVMKSVGEFFTFSDEEGPLVFTKV